LPERAEKVSGDVEKGEATASSKKTGFEGGREDREGEDIPKGHNGDRP